MGSAVAMVEVQGCGACLLLPLAAKGDLHNVLKQYSRYPVGRLVMDVPDALHICRVLLQGSAHIATLVSVLLCTSPAYNACICLTCT